MTMTDRDKKIALVLVPVLLLAAYWFLALSPKRSEAQRLGTELAQVEQTRDDALSRVAILEGSRESYAKDYATVVRLGKAIPSTLDMPSLLVQLDEAARGTQIRFGKVTAGTRDAAANPAPPAPTSGSTTPAPAGDAAAGGAPAQTAPGQAAEAAGNTVESTNQTSAAQSGESSAPVAAGDGTTTTAPPGLDSLPLTFEFSGGFFDLADFFHELKRFIRVSGSDIDVSGRLMTIDGLKFGESESLTEITATVSATAYVSPKAEGATGGATPTGPAQTVPAGAAPTTPPSTPTASVTP